MVRYIFLFICFSIGILLIVGIYNIPNDRHDLAVYEGVLDSYSCEDLRKGSRHWMVSGEEEFVLKLNGTNSGCASLDAQKLAAIGGQRVKMWYGRARTVYQLNVADEVVFDLEKIAAARRSNYLGLLFFVFCCSVITAVQIFKTSSKINTLENS